MVPYFLFDCLELYMDGLLGGFFLELNLEPCGCS